MNKHDITISPEQISMTGDRVNVYLTGSKSQAIYTSEKALFNKNSQNRSPPWKNL